MTCRLLLLLDQKENQQLLAEELADEHEIAIGADGDLAGDFDVLVVDGRSLDRLWEQVQRRKEKERPIFLPVLLVTSRPGVKMVTRHLWRSVDELLIAPIEKPELRARLAVLLRARSLSLALRQRVEEAEQAKRSRDEVLAMVAHDLRSPLQLVLAASDHLLDDPDGLAPRQREAVQRSRNAARQMSRLTQDLLEMSGIEAGQLHLDRQAVEIPPLLDEACGQYADAAEKRGIDLGCGASDELPAVDADRRRVLQVLDNLIGNALKFSSEGGRIRVTAQRAEDGVRCSVSDTGPGLGPEALEHVFDRFWRADPARQQGTGLGLAISRGIVTAHGGRIWAESAAGEGSTFHFTLPAAEKGA